MTGLETAVALVLRCRPRFGLPAPIRRAHAPSAGWIRRHPPPGRPRRSPWTKAERSCKIALQRTQAVHRRRLALLRSLRATGFAPLAPHIGEDPMELRPALSSLDRVRRPVRFAALLLAVGLVQSASPARAEMPSVKELLDRFGISASDAQKAMNGEFVRHDLESSNERELTAGFVFLVKDLTPTELVRKMREGEGERADPNTLAFHLMTGDPGPADFAKLTLRPDPQKQAKAFLEARPGEDLNLSKEEIAAFQKLGSGASTQEVEAQVREMLLARLQAYRQKGLAGIAPYARGDGETRSPADDLRSATKALKALEKYLPRTYQYLLDYPQGEPAGTEELFRWSQISAHGEPTLVLTHNVYIPEGDAWVGMQRQFYVSTGYNCEQATAAFLPVKGGTAVFYGNRTSTDQVMGFGGGAKRSLGGKVLASQLEALFEKVRDKVGAAGG